MGKFRNEFRDFTSLDYMGFAGAEKLPNGESPKICDVENSDDLGVCVIISGSYDGDTVISLETEIGSYIIQIPGYNKVHVVVADAIVDELKMMDLNIKDAIAYVKSDFDMMKI